MMNEDRPNDTRDLWQSQSVEAFKMSLDQVRASAERHRKVRAGNRIGYTAGLAGAGFLAIAAWRSGDPLLGLACAVCIAGLLYALSQFHKKAAGRAVPADLAPAACLHFYRSELERQRDAFRTSWSWLLAPLIPGVVMLAVVAGIKNPGHSPHIGRVVAGWLGACAFAFFWVAKRHQRYARKLQQQVDELNAAAESRMPRTSP